MNICTMLGLVMLGSAVVAPYAHADDYSAAHTAVVERFKSDEEPTAKDAVWAASNTLKIGVYDNGSRRDGYAEYACTVLRDYNVSELGMRVQIIDYGTLIKDHKWHEIGEAWCPEREGEPRVISFE